MFHAHQSEFTELGWQGFFEVSADGHRRRPRAAARADLAARARPAAADRRRGSRVFAALDAPGLGERRGPPAEELAVERTVLEPGEIAADRPQRRPGRGPVAQVVVNDAFAQFTGADEPIGRLETATVTVMQPWVEGEAYEVALLTSTGGTIVHEIPVAVADARRPTSASSG